MAKLRLKQFDPILSGSLRVSGSSDVTGSLSVSANISALGNISGSSTSTGSFGELQSTTATIPNLQGNVALSPTNVAPVSIGGDGRWITLDGTNYSGGSAYTVDGTTKAGHYWESNYLRHQGIANNTGHKFTVRDGSGNYLHHFFESDGNVEFVGNVSSSATSTGSFGSGFFDGRVGIYQKTPTAELHISSPSSQPGIRVDGAYANIQIEGDNLAHISLKDEGATSGERVYQINSDGGILAFNRTNDAISSVTATPLKLKDDKVEVLNISGSSTSTGSFGNAQLSTIHAHNSNGFKIFDDGGNEAIWVENGGNVSIGHSNPYYKLDVTGGLGVSDCSLVIDSNGLAIGNDTKYFRVGYHGDIEIIHNNSSHDYGDGANHTTITDRTDTGINIKTGTTHGLLLSGGNVQVSANLSGSSTSTGSFGRIFSKGDIETRGDIIARQYIVSSSVTHMTTSFSSGSTVFGDTLDDSHQFTGSLHVTSSALTIDGRYGHVSGSVTSTGSFGKVDADGSLVVGSGYTSSPDAKLQVLNDASPSTNGNLIAKFGATYSGGTTGFGGYIDFTDPDGTAVGRIRSYTDGSNVIGFDFGTWNSSLQEGRLHIKGDGNVGIGTQTPVAKLHVWGTISGSDYGGNISGSSTSTGSFGTLMADLVSGSSTSTGSFGQLVVGDDIELVEDQRIYFEADKGTWIESNMSDAFRMVAGGSQMLLLDYDTGNRAVFGNGTKVYIGADNNKQPDKELVVDGDISGSSTSTGSFGSVSVGGGTNTFGRVAINGANASVPNGPHIKLTTDSDVYPLFSVTGWQHDNISLFFDSYYDGATRSSDAGSNYRIHKSDDKLKFLYDSGVSQGSTQSWKDGILLDTSGNVEVPTGNISGSASSTGSFGNLITDTVSIGGGGAITVDELVVTNITASGNISASGTVFADSFTSTGGDVAGISFADDLNITGDVTASGHFSGSATSTGSFGRLEADVIEAKQFVVSSSVTNIVTIDVSGSTMFGDTGDDTHRFTGSVHIQSGSVSQELYTTTNADTMFFGRYSGGIPVSGSSNMSRFISGSDGSLIDVGYTTTDENGNLKLTTIGDGIHNDTTNYWYNNNFFRVGKSGEIDGPNFQGLHSQYVHYDTVNVKVKGDLIATTGSLQGEMYINSPNNNRMFIGKYTGGIPVSGSSNISRYASGSDGSIVDVGFTATDEEGVTTFTSTGDGIYVDTNNYWYTTGDFKIGSAANFINWDNTGLSFTGPLTASGDLIPSTHNSYDLGSDSYRWANIYTADLQLSNESATPNEVDGTTGSWTIQEGEDDLYLLNRKNGKKYRFKLEEIE